MNKQFLRFLVPVFSSFCLFKTALCFDLRHIDWATDSVSYRIKCNLLDEKFVEGIIPSVTERCGYNGDGQYSAFLPAAYKKLLKNSLAQSDPQPELLLYFEQHLEKNGSWSVFFKMLGQHLAPDEDNEVNKISPLSGLFLYQVLTKTIGPDKTIEITKKIVTEYCDNDTSYAGEVGRAQGETERRSPHITQFRQRVTDVQGPYKLPESRQVNSLLDNEKIPRLLAQLLPISANMVITVPSTRDSDTLYGSIFKNTSQLLNARG